MCRVIELSNTVILRRALLTSKRALKAIVHSGDLSEKHAKKTGLLNDKFMCFYPESYDGGKAFRLCPAILGVWRWCAHRCMLRT